jgi:hypothetical protein
MGLSKNLYKPPKTFFMDILKTSKHFHYLSSMPTSLLYNISHMISTHFYFYKHVLNDMGIHLSKKIK